MNELEIRGLRELIKEEIEEIVDEKVREILAERQEEDDDADLGEDGSGEDLPQEEQEEEEVEVVAPKIVTSGQKVSKEEMKALNRPKKKVEPEEEEFLEDDETQEWED